MEQLETGNIGIGNTSTLATLNNDRFIIVDQKEIFWTGASLKDAGRMTFAAAKMYPPSEASCEAGSMRGARRSSPGFSNRSARRHLHGGNTARARRWYENRARRRGCEKDILPLHNSPVGNW